MFSRGLEPSPVSLPLPAHSGVRLLNHQTGVRAHLRSPKCTGCKHARAPRHSCGAFREPQAAQDPPRRAPFGWLPAGFSSSSEVSDGSLSARWGWGAQRDLHSSRFCFDLLGEVPCFIRFPPGTRTPTFFRTAAPKSSFTLIRVFLSSRPPCFFLCLLFVCVSRD